MFESDGSIAPGPPAPAGRSRGARGSITSGNWTASIVEPARSAVQYDFIAALSGSRYQSQAGCVRCVTVELRQLEYFLVVAEELNFRRAAERLHMTQPPLSQAIRQLEQELELTLFERTTRQVRLTAAGEVFRQRVIRLLRQLNEDVVEARGVANGLAGQLGLGFVPSATLEILPPLLRVYRSRFPQVRLVLHELSPEQQVHGLRNGSLDCACFYLPPGDTPPFGDHTLNAIPISREPLVVALPSDHKLAASRRINLGSLACEPFVMVSGHPGPGLRDIVLEQCRQGEFLPNVVQEAAMIQTIAGLVASGVGVALLPASVRRLQRYGVAYRPLDKNPLHVRMGVVWHDSTENAVVGGFIKVAQDSAATDSR
jgi:DNA-binding transcriptional LysR family regulator